MQDAHVDLIIALERVCRVSGGEGGIDDGQRSVANGQVENVTGCLASRAYHRGHRHLIPRKVDASPSSIDPSSVATAALNTGAIWSREYETQ